MNSLIQIHKNFPNYPTFHDRKLKKNHLNLQHLCLALQKKIKKIQLLDSVKQKNLEMEENPWFKERKNIWGKTRKQEIRHMQRNHEKDPKENIVK